MDERLKEEGDVWVALTREDIASLPSSSAKTFALHAVKKIDENLRRVHTLNDEEGLDAIQLEMLKLMKYLAQLKHEPPRKT